MKDNIINESSASVSIGGMLSSARERREISVEAVAKALKLSPHVICSIENDNFDQFPASIYLRGYLRSYSKLIGLTKDESEWMREEILAMSDLDREAPSSSLSPVFETPAPKKRGLRFFGLLIFVLVCITTIFWAAGRYHPNSPLSKKDFKSIGSSKVLMSSGTSIPLSLSDSSESPAAVAQIAHVSRLGVSNVPKGKFVIKKKTLRKRVQLSRSGSR